MAKITRQSLLQHKNRSCTFFTRLKKHLSVFDLTKFIIITKEEAHNRPLLLFRMILLKHQGAQGKVFPDRSTQNQEQGMH